MREKMVLFLWEPPSVLPENWNPSLHQKFKYVFSWSDSKMNNNNFVKIFWPQTRNFPDLEIIEFRKKKLLVSISMNKRSSHPRELYSEREKAIRHFEKNQKGNFDFFGVGWDNNKDETFNCYKGSITNKWDVLPYYKFSLCYENLVDEPGFVTEKIFDCFRSGCVPIYWGAPNITDYVDKNTFIDRREFKDNAELEEYLTGMKETEYNVFIQAINNYLESSRFSIFLPEYFAKFVEAEKTGWTYACAFSNFDLLFLDLLLLLLPYDGI
jgi:hypothetical protein